jgi:uncharacterized protein VirK/YbjX
MLYKRAKYCVRGLVCPAATAEWFQLLENPALAGVVRRDPNLLQKLQRPYLASIFPTSERLRVLRQHYQFVLDRLSARLVAEIYSPTGKCLASLPAEGVGDFELRLGFSRLDKEGELSLRLWDCQTDRPLFTLTFSVAHFDAGRREIIIGGLQGNRLALDRDLVIALTRGWHGLRPKALLLFTVQQLAAAWNITTLRAVGDTTHIYQHWRKRKQLPSSYDEWWQESGGCRAADGLFDLPARFVPREVALLKVNKRPLYRKRYQMLAELAEQIRANLASLPEKSSPLRCPAALVEPNPASAERKEEVPVF